MPDPAPKNPRDTYALGTAARLTGISPDVLRAWERRHGVVTPLRTPGGTRRYTADDVERLRRVKAAVDAGHRIGQLAKLDDAELEKKARAPHEDAHRSLTNVLAAISRLDPIETRRLLAVQFAALGAQRFAVEFAYPLIEEIGERWANGKLSIAAEHLATSVLGDMLGTALQPTAANAKGPRIVFATLPGERHALGLQMASLTAVNAGANPVYLGPDVPTGELVQAVRTTGANVLALSMVSCEKPCVEDLRRVRDELPRRCHLWVGGYGSSKVPPIQGVERLDGLGALERAVTDFKHTRAPGD